MKKYDRQPMQLNLFNLIGEYEIRREAFGVGQHPYTRWYWFYWIYKNGVKIIKFTKKETAVAYVRDLLGRNNPNCIREEQIIQGAPPQGWVEDGIGERKIPF